MGGHSKKSGCGGGGGSGRSNNKHQQPKKLKKDLGVPDLKDSARKLTVTAQRKSHSVMSLHLDANGQRRVTPAGGGGGGVIRGSAAERMARAVARRADALGGHGHSKEATAAPSLSEEERLAKQRREMAALALRTSEKVHDYEIPTNLYYGGNEDGTSATLGGDDTLLEEVDRRGTDKSLRRFFKEFNRVVESCDVLLQVLDARDPLGCRLTKLEQNIRSSYGEDKKKIVVVLNKVDMLPSKEVVDAWIDYFENQEHITCVPFAATAKGSVGQSYVHSMFRKLRALARGDTGEGNDRKAIVVGVIGYPNVGKSSIINALKRKNVVGVGNMPGFTTGNTEVELRSDIRVMDCPGVVMPGEDNGDVVLRGAVRVSDLANPFTPVQRLLQRCTALSDVDLAEGLDDSDNEEGGRGAASAPLHRIHPLAQFYGIGSLPADDVMEFIRLVGLQRGRLVKGGQVDEEGTARMILDDWNSGRIGYYTYPPAQDDFFAGDNFRVTRRHNKDGGEEEEEEEGVHGGVALNTNIMASLSRGITFDGLPTFHLCMNRIAAGKGSRKKWSKNYADQAWEEAEQESEEDDDDDDDYGDDDGDDDDEVL